MTLKICLCFLFVILSVIPTLASYCSTSDYYVIRNKQTSYALDATDTEVKMQFFDGNSAQLWKFVCGSKPGQFYITNKDSLYRLDVEKGTEKVIVSKHDTSVYQEWYINSNGTIVNAELNEILTTGTADIGIQVQVHQKVGTVAYDYFVLQDME